MQTDLTRFSGLTHVLVLGRFTGEDIGYARATLGAGSSLVAVRSRVPGASTNGNSVALVDIGVATPQTTVRQVDLAGNLVVTLRHNGTAVVATAAEVAAAINAFKPSGPYAQQRPLFTAGIDPSTDGSGVVSAGILTLAGGVDHPPAVNGVTRIVRQTGNGGLFHFGQTLPFVAHQFEARLSESVPWTLDIVTTDAAGGIYPEVTQVAAGTGDKVFFTNMGVVLVPGRSLRFVADASGFASVYGSVETAWRK